MYPGQETFNLTEALNSAGQAFLAVVCHVGFDAALHGLVMVLVLAAGGAVLRSRRHRFGSPLLSVARKVSLFCLVLMVPGTVSLLTSGNLPPTGNLQISSLGFFAFWSMVSLHLTGEEMNFQWF